MTAFAPHHHITIPRVRITSKVAAIPVTINQLHAEVGVWVLQYQCLKIKIIT
jgi:hypothetical protein